MNPGRSLLAVRPGEGRLVALLCAMFATAEAGRGLGDVALVTLFLSRVDAAVLPWLFVALGLVSLVVALGYGAAIGRLPRRPFVVGLLAAFAGTLVVLRVAAATDSIPVFGAMWVVVNVIHAILLTLTWTVAGTTLDVRQAKRLFPICTSVAIAGSFAGTLVSGPLAGALGTETLLVLEAALLLAAAVAAWRVIGRTGGRQTPAAATTTALRAQLRRGYDDVRASPLLRLIAVAYLLFAVLLFSVTFPYQRELQVQFRDRPAELATTVGLVLAGVTAISFFVSLVVANRVYARFGVATAALALPLVYVAGFGIWLVQFGLATAIGFVAAQMVVQRSISNAAWSAMFTVVPADRRPQVLAFIDGVPGQLGTSLSGVLLLLGTALFATSLAPIFVMGLVTAVGLTWIVARIRTRYGEALIRTLRAGLAEQVLDGGAGLAAVARAPGVGDALRAGLADPSAATRRLAAELLGRLDDETAVGPLDGLLSDEAPEVRAAGLRALATLDRDRGADAATRLAADPDPAVRAESAVAIGRAHGVESIRPALDELLAGERRARLAGIAAAGRIGDVSLLEPILRTLQDDPDAAIRGAAATALGGMPGLPAVDALVAALDDDSPAVRRAAADALGRLEGAGPALVAVLESGSERAQVAAIRGLAGGVSAGDDAAIRAWALRRVDRAVVLRRYAAAVRPAVGTDDPTPETPALDFLRAMLERRGRGLEEQLLSAVGALGAPEAPSLLRRCLRSPDSDTRAQAIEAIDALGDRRLAQAIVRLLDSDARAVGRDVESALAALADDDDPWLRTLAMRSVAEALAQRQADLARRAAADPDPAVRRRLGTMHPEGGATMADTAATLGELDRMLFLRRVPLFEQLEPEDLQRLAATATERLFEAGEALVREGEAGDELIVLVEGTVRVVRIEDGVERHLRTYRGGDHIGELAVLRERPRAATVIADTVVRGLVIGGDGLRALLAERPDAAMAMLGTLAERISAQ